MSEAFGELLVRMVEAVPQEVAERAFKAIAAEERERQARMGIKPVSLVALLAER